MSLRGNAPPLLLRLAALVQGIEAIGLLAASVIGAVDTASGQSYSKSNGMALTVLGFITMLILAAIAWGLSRVRPWTRTPAVMTQVIVAIVAVLLLQGSRYDWGVPALLLALAGLGTLLAPASLRGLQRPPVPPPEPRSRKTASRPRRG